MKLPGAVSENWVFLHSANDRLYPISVDMESKLPVIEMLPTGIFVLDVGIKGTPKTCRDRCVCMLVRVAAFGCRFLC